MDARELTVERFLTGLGAAALPHPGGTLLDHLHRVRRTLVDWGAADPIGMAGFCHACYGTDGFAPALLELARRDLLTSAIGSAAESLVYLYASCDRDFVYPRLHGRAVPFRDRFTGEVFSLSGDRLRAFVEITAANELDVVRSNAEMAEKYGPELAALFEGAEAHLSSSARRAWLVAARELWPA